MAKRDWDRVLFWLWRLIGFVLGSFVGFNLINIVNRHLISSYNINNTTMFIIVTGIIQKNNRHSSVRLIAHNIIE